VIRHIGDTASGDDLDRALINAREHCSRSARGSRRNHQMPALRHEATDSRLTLRRLIMALASL
jgi:hypothetical protein